MRFSLARLLMALILASLIIPRTLGQISDTWQPVTQQDLALKDNPAVPGSAAMILERQIYTDDEKRLQTEWIRIKILTERGKAYADVQIPYLGRITTIEGIRGRTVLADGTVIPFSGTVFDNVLVRYKRFRYDAKTFTLPGVEVGSVIEYAYTIRWKQKLPDYVRNPSGYMFQEGWTIPSTTWTVQQDLFIRHALFVLRPIARGRLGWSTVRIKEGPSSQPDGTVRIEVADVPALEKDDYMPPESMLTSRIHLYYEVGFLTNYWRDWGKSRVQGAAKFIEKTKFLEQEANAIAPPAASPEDRLRKLYARVQQVRNLSYEVDKTEKEMKRENLAENKSSDDIYRHGYGYGNEIDFLFTALARSAGFDATIVEAVSRDSAAFEQKVPDGSQLNTLLVQIRLDGKSLYFDPASRFCPYGQLPWYEVDTSGVRWDRSGGEVVNIPREDESSVLDRTAQLKLQADGTLDGKLEIVLTRQQAMELRSSAADEDEAGRTKLIEDKIKSWTPSGTSIVIEPGINWSEIDEPLKIRCHIQIPRFAILTPHRMIFPISVFQAGSNGSPFTQVYRHQPVYLAYGYSGRDEITISLPAGWDLEAMPSDASCDNPAGVFHFKRTTAAGTVHLERRTFRSDYYFPQGSYKTLRQYHDELRQRDAEDVVLHKSVLEH
jgi:hypothetical protein